MPGAAGHTAAGQVHTIPAAHAAPLRHLRTSQGSFGQQHRCLHAHSGSRGFRQHEQLVVRAQASQETDEVRRCSNHSNMAYKQYQSLNDEGSDLCSIDTQFGRCKLRLVAHWTPRHACAIQHKLGNGFLQETYDLDAPLDETSKKLIDAAGAGQSNMSPGWLTELGRLWGGTSVTCCTGTCTGSSLSLSPFHLLANMQQSGTLADTHRPPQSHLH